MAYTFTIRCPRHLKPFDNSDNPCCWQLGEVCGEIETILDGAGIKYVSIFEDWGAAYSWMAQGAVRHSLMVSCADVDEAKYEIDCTATRKRFLGIRREDVTESSDFQRIHALLLALDQNA